MSQLIQFSLRASVSEPSHFPEGRRRKFLLTSGGCEQWPRGWMGRGSGPFECLSDGGAGKLGWGEERVGEKWNSFYTG